jgi:hypothetical protein
MAFRWLRRFCPTPEQQVAEFCKHRNRESDSEFVSNCCPAAQADAARVAIAVRRAIARLGQVHPEFIRHDDNYPAQLGKLPMWDSIEWLQFFLELEDELGVRISDGQMRSFFEPDSNAGMSVSKMVSRVRRILDSPHD